MQITIINGIPGDNYNAYEDGLNASVQKLSNDHNVDLFTIRDLKINYCRGCFNCWLKTPGECMFKDDMPTILKSIIGSDLLIFVSRVITGFVSSETKKAMDRMLPILLPYIKVYHKECHHVPRYDTSFKTGLMLIDDNKIDDNLKECIYDIFDRLSLNMHTNIAFKKSTDSQDFKEVLIHEACNC